MKTETLISVIMPVYNCERFLSASIESILNQTYRHFEFIIIDNQSSDQSWEICCSYAQRDSRIKVLRNDQNCGIVFSRNRGFSAISDLTEFVAIMDSDDIACLSRFERQIFFFQNNPEHYLLGGKIDVIDENGCTIGQRCYPLTDREIRSVMTRFDPFAQPSVMFRRDVISRIGVYDERFEPSEDYHFWFRIMDHHQAANLNEVILYYRLRKEQAKTLQLKRTLRQTIRIQSKWFFDKRYFSFKNLFFFLAEISLFIFPSWLILWLFQKKYFKKIKI